MPKLKDDMPAVLKPFRFHGVALDFEEGRDHSAGDCPFCNSDGKFSVDNASGLWRCFVCNEGTETGKPIKGGNAITFLRLLWERSKENTSEQDYERLAADRRLLSPETLARWGVCRSSVDGCWLVPGFNIAGELVQLYRYGKDKVLRCTAEMSHGLFGADRYNADKGEVWICEGPWDGMAAEEVLVQAKRDSEGTLRRTGNEELSLYADVNILAVPGCTTFYEPWISLAGGKKTSLLFDSDHPHLSCPDCQPRKSYSKVLYGESGCPQCGAKLVGPERPPGGWEGMRRVAQLLAASPNPPAAVNVLRWSGDDGYDTNLPSGYDVRDWLSLSGEEGQYHDLGERLRVMEQLIASVVPMPAEWAAEAAKKPSRNLAPIPCRTWKELITRWKKALTMRQDIDDTLSVAMAVCLSTSQVGDQLFLQMVANAGSAKTRLCEALLVSRHCHALEHLTGFHSGWKDASGEDFSLLTRINHKTLITPEGDVLINSPNFMQLMSQQRRIFDGTSGASYKNRKEDLSYTGLRTPWIIAGTPAILAKDQSHLGDRFLRVYIGKPDDDERRRILRRVGYSALQSVIMTSDGTPDSRMEESMSQAYQATGGYVDYLRANAGKLLGAVRMDEEEVIDRCITMAEFVAMMRPRPEGPGEHVVEDPTELPTRLTHQFVRLSRCLAVVLNRSEIDDEVMRRVDKVAVDTARGNSMRVVEDLHRAGEAGSSTATLGFLIGLSEIKMTEYMRFLRRIGVVRKFTRQDRGVGGTVTVWGLTERMAELYNQVKGKTEEVDEDGVV